uniref:DRBM domain-containing protein n=1 Tax=Timema genevievae TaxID=629358 RepID=A0A7R9JTC6_TIMGE|nr:unnamed protein product [Timema genevievae]
MLLDDSGEDFIISLDDNSEDSDEVQPSNREHRKCIRACMEEEWKIILEKSFSLHPTEFQISISPSLIGSLVNCKSNTTMDSNTVGELQEYCTKHCMSLPSYRVTMESGPPHNKTFTITCQVEEHTTKGTSNSKKDAKKRAATSMMPIVMNCVPATQAAPPTLSTAWTAPQSIFSKPSVTGSPLYTAPKRTPVSIGSHDGHYPFNLHAPMGSPCFSHWSMPGSSGGYLTRKSNLFNTSPPSPYLPPRLTVPGIPHVPPRLTLPEHPSVPPRLTLPEHPYVPPRLTLPDHTRRPFSYPRGSDYVTASRTSTT